MKKEFIKNAMYILSIVCVIGFILIFSIREYRTRNGI